MIGGLRVACTSFGSNRDELRVQHLAVTSHAENVHLVQGCMASRLRLALNLWRIASLDFTYHSVATAWSAFDYYWLGN